MTAASVRVEVTRRVVRKLLCTACGFESRTEVRIAADGKLVTVLEGCTRCRSGIYREETDR